MLKRTAIDIHTQPTTKQQRLTCALNSARLLPDGWCCLMVGAASTIKEMRSSSDSTSHRHLNDRWIGRDGPMAWPPRSPDVTPMNFFLWDHIKALIYTSPVDSEEDFIARIVEAATYIFERTRQSLLRRCQLLPWSVVVSLNICSKLVKNTTLFRTLS